MHKPRMRPGYVRTDLQTDGKQKGQAISHPAPLVRYLT